MVKIYIVYQNQLCNTYIPKLLKNNALNNKVETLRQYILELNAMFLNKRQSKKRERKS